MFKCECSESLNRVDSLFGHFNSFHHCALFVCGLRNCAYSSERLNLFSKHIYQTHGLKNSTPSQIFSMITDRQSFFAKFQEVLPQLHVPDLSFNVSNNSLIEHNDYSTLNSNAVQSDPNDFSFVKKFGKLAFKYHWPLTLAGKRLRNSLFSL